MTVKRLRSAFHRITASKSYKAPTYFQPRRDTRRGFCLLRQLFGGFVASLSSGHSSGIPARDVSSESTPASSDVLPTISQLISEITADVPIAARAVCATVLSARMPAFRSQSFQQRFMDYPLSACGFEGRLISWYEKALCTVQSAFTIKRSYI